MPHLPDRIAQAALHQFDKLPLKCKPRAYSDSRGEWTPMSAVVGVRGGVVECLSLGTGTKCLPASAIPKCSGSVLHDSHAEVLALRGFNRWVLNELEHSYLDPKYESVYVEQNASIDIKASRTTIINDHHYPFRFKEDVSFHFFSTEAPCGDASMELLIKSKDPKDAVPWDLPAQNLARPEAFSLPGRGYFSCLGAVRRKPARNDAEASMSKSCTDKLAMKQFTGLLSFPADIFIEPSLSSFIQSLVVFHDQYDPVAYERAFGSGGRLAQNSRTAHFLEVTPLPSSFPTFAFEKIRTDASIKASNISAVSVAGPGNSPPRVVEVLLNGVKQGYKRFEERYGKRSALCRESLWNLGKRVAVAAQAQTSFNPDPGILAALGPIQSCLRMSTYKGAKCHPIRERKRNVKYVVAESLGNWISNAGDEEWSLETD